MSRLTWGALAERYYENGVDRGVLYVGVDAGVPWNGLVSVSESPTGGEAKPAYIDGYKFRNLASAEEFEATIDAFSAPKEFGPCDGTAAIQNGLFITQQPRKAFGFSYRTFVGDAVGGGESNYKIHLVYNALAAPSSQANNTLSDSAEAVTKSWSITTRSPMLTSHKPTAHFVIDSRYTPRGLLAAIEDILYGTDEYAPRLPDVDELMETFQSQGPLVRRNLVLDPKVTTTAGWNVLGTGTVKALDTTAFDSPPSSLKITAGTTAPDAVYGWGVYLDPRTDLDPAGTRRAWGVRLYSPTDLQVKVWPILNLGWSTSIVVDLLAGLWQDVYFEFTSNVAITNQYIIIGTSVPSAVFNVDNIYLGTPGEYFDGDTLDENFNYHSWEGAVNNSRSLLFSWN